MQGWISIGAERAAQHPLYGLVGWLRLFSLLMALTAFSGPLVTVLFAARVAALPEPLLPAGLVLVAVMALGAAAGVVLATLWFRRDERFLRAYAEISLITVLLDLLGELLIRRWGPLPAAFGEGEGNLAADLLLSLLLSGIPIWLLWRSRRFRVTFHHQVRADDVVLTR